MKLFPAIHCNLFVSFLVKKDFRFYRGYYFCLAAKVTKRPSSKNYNLENYLESWLRAKPLAQKGSTLTPFAGAFFVVFYDSNLMSRQVGSDYFIFASPIRPLASGRWLALCEKSFSYVWNSKDEAVLLRRELQMEEIIVSKSGQKEPSIRFSHKC